VPCQLRDEARRCLHRRAVRLVVDPGVDTGEPRKLGHLRPSDPRRRVRRVGNSNVVSIPREYEANGYTPGTSVLVEELPGGELRLLPTEKLGEQIAEIGRRVVDEHTEALRIPAEHDPDR
jgi:antitoxin component of MazEF toxin-antitoxin module